MVLIKGGKVFQRRCLDRVVEVLSEHGRDDIRFAHLTDGLDRFVADFTFKGKPHTIGVYEDDVTMTEGPSLFECYMPAEFASESALIEGFATRLNRYLSGGPWEGPEEKGLPSRIKERVKGFLRRQAAP